MAKKIGTLIKEARTGAGLTQAQLAEKVTGLSPSDISKAERGEKALPQDMLKKIAKACGVTQASLTGAAEKKPAAKKTAAKKLTPAKKTEAKKTEKAEKAEEKTTSLRLTATEKKLVELYRKASSQKQEEALKVLQEEDENPLLNVLGDVLGALLK